jgi:hypothetical protein
MNEYRRHATYGRVILDLDVAGQIDGVGDDRPILDVAVVRNVDIGHQEIPVADSGFRPLAGGPMDRGVFPDDVLVPDLHAARLALELEILGDAADGHPVEDLVVAADERVAIDQHRRSDHTVWTDLHVRTDDGVGTDADVEAQTGLRMHHGCGMNLRRPQGARPRDRFEVVAIHLPPPWTRELNVPRWST